MLATSLGFLFAFTLILLQVPIAFALALTGVGGYALLSGLPPALSMVATITQNSTLVYTLTVLPLFVLMGNLVAGAGISGDLYRAAQAFIGRRRGGLAMATVVACGGFGAICGSSTATAATMARVAVPSMRECGYADSLSTAAVAAGGTLGTLIPPSIIMVVYGVATQTHIGMLFAAGLLPGLLAILGYVYAVKWTVWRNPATAPVATASAQPDRLRLLRGLWPVIVLFGVVMGGIYGGLFTATEASGVGASGAMLFALRHHSLKIKDIYAILVDTTKISAMMFAIIFGAAMFGEFVNITGVHKALEGVVTGSGLPPFGVVLVIIAIYVLLGCVLESLSMILLTIPIFFPVIMALGYDPVWFGVLIVVVTEIGLITPPIGVNLFVIRSVVPDVSMGTIIRGVVPFIVVDVARILVIAAIPGLSLWLPHLLFRT